MCEHIKNFMSQNYRAREDALTNAACDYYLSNFANQQGPANPVTDCTFVHYGLCRATVSKKARFRAMPKSPVKRAPPVMPNAQPVPAPQIVQVVSMAEQVRRKS